MAEHKSVDATSRLPLYVISRILIDYLTMQKNQEAEQRRKKDEAYRRQHYFQV